MRQSLVERQQTAGGKVCSQALGDGLMQLLRRRGWRFWRLQPRSHGFRQLADVLRSYEPSVVSNCKGLRDAVQRRGDDRFAAGKGFQHDSGKGLGSELCMDEAI